MPRIGAVSKNHFKEAIEAVGKASKMCPVTNGLPTTMTMDGFLAACERCREQNRNGWESGRPYKHTWCDTCQGQQQPGELRIVSLAKLAGQRRIKAEMKRRPGNAGTFPGQRDGATQA